MFYELLLQIIYYYKAHITHFTPPLEKHLLNSKSSSPSKNRWQSEWTVSGRTRLSKSVTDGQYNRPTNIHTYKWIIQTKTKRKKRKNVACNVHCVACGMRCVCVHVCKYSIHHYLQHSCVARFCISIYNRHMTDRMRRGGVNGKMDQSSCWKCKGDFLLLL